MLKPYYKDEWVKHYCSDALKVLPDLLDESIDLLCTDPPYGISFMGKDWDKALPDKRIWRECLRVLKPGAFAFVMSIPRQDCLSRMIVSLEDVGFLVNFTPIFWTYASGFPKAQNIGKAVDKRCGISVSWFGKWLKDWRTERGISQKEIAKLFPSKTGGLTGCVANWELGLNIPTPQEFTTICRHYNLPFESIEEVEREAIGIQKHKGNIGYENEDYNFKPNERLITKPATSQAKVLDGSYGGFQPKPAVEVILVCMKPLSETTFVDQALKNRKGITWLDDGRIPYDGEIPNMGGRKTAKMGGNQPYGFKIEGRPDTPNIFGRFPANLLVSDDVLNDGRVINTHSTGKHCPADYRRNWIGQNFGGVDYQYQGDSGSFSRYFDLDKWAQKTFPFLIVPKASKGEKNKGISGIEAELGHNRFDICGNCGGYILQNPDRPSACLCENPLRQHNKVKGNYHPTVKPVKLMSYLVTLGSRAGDIVIDPFMGSGTTPLACKLLNRKCIGIEILEEYCHIAATRCSQAVFDLSSTGISGSYDTTPSDANRQPTLLEED